MDWSPALKNTKALRLFRLLCEINILHPLDIFIYAFGQTCQSIRHYINIIIVYVITFALVGQQLFAYRARFKEPESYEIAENSQEKRDGVSPRTNFDTFYNAVIGVILFIYNEEWHMTMYDYYRNYSK